MNGLGLFIVIICLLAAWWQWAEKDRYRDLYHDSLCNNPKKLPETKEEEEVLGIEYDETIPHPFKSNIIKETVL